ncbi:hypothetical protein [Pseudomonas sp.]|uniref:hypothetical protein n=1 Tax=Pseudomonas sp. TaxID=306 RepID=UPI003265104B
MVEKVRSSTSTLFKVERPMRCRAFIEDERLFTATVELTGGVVTCTLDESEYCFTAQQCGELADSLATVVKTTLELAVSPVRVERPLNLHFCKIFYQMILSRSSTTRGDRLHGYGYDSGGKLVGASGSFRYPGTRDSYKLFVGFDDELYLPFLGIEDWVYTFSFGETIWLIEQLCVGGYLLAQVEQSKEEFKNDEGEY